MPYEYRQVGQSSYNLGTFLSGNVCLHGEGAARYQRDLLSDLPSSFASSQLLVYMKMARSHSTVDAFCNIIFWKPVCCRASGDDLDLDSDARPSDDENQDNDSGDDAVAPASSSETGSRDSQGKPCSLWDLLPHISSEASLTESIFNVFWIHQLETWTIPRENSTNQNSHTKIAAILYLHREALTSWMGYCNPAMASGIP